MARWKTPSWFRLQWEAFIFLLPYLMSAIVIIYTIDIVAETAEKSIYRLEERKESGIYVFEDVPEDGNQSAEIFLSRQRQ